MTSTARVATTFTLLLGAHFAYSHGFAVVADRLQPPARAPLDLRAIRQKPTRTGEEATALATRVFGEGHWAARSSKRYYNVERGYWMYWQEFDQPKGHDGRRVVFKPFAVIWHARDDKSVKVVSADNAIVDFKQEFNLFKGGGKLELAYARIEGGSDYVYIKDDKGTDDLADDLIVTMPYAEYLEDQGLIRCDDTIHLTERDVTVQGDGLEIALRRKVSGKGDGFPGAETVTLKRNPIIQAEDVGKTGILPGAARVEQQIPAGQTVEASKTPVKITSSGPMVLRLPPPKIPPWVGPPELPAATLVDFSRNVVVKRGAGLPDQIDGDHLHAVLIPRERPAGQAAPKDDTLGSLTLYQAHVQGHNVWLQSEAERLKGRGNELIYHKPGPDLPEETYFLADRGKKITLERREADGSLLLVSADDATMRSDPKKQGTTITARGRGWLEQRADHGQPIERSASWRDEVVVETFPGAPRPADAKGPRTSAEASRTHITLKGWPVVDDPAQVIMASRDQMIVCLRERLAEEAPRGPALLAADIAPAGPLTPDGQPPKGNANRIEWVSAFGDVHMITPELMPDGRPSPDGPRFLNAREKLDVVFEYPKPLDPTAAAPNPGGVRPASYRPGQDDRPALGGFGSPTPVGDLVASAEPTADAQAGPIALEAEQALDVAADKVWARVEMSPEGGGLNNLSTRSSPGQPTGRNDLKDVRLRGDVRVLQDAAEGREQGLDLKAAAVDVVNHGKGRLHLTADGWPGRPAVLVSPEMTIEGPRLGVQQDRHYAWVDGAGTLTMQAEPGTMGVTSVVADGEAVPVEDKPTEKVPLTIHFNQEMTFHGLFPDDRGRPGPARALFVGDVDADMEDDHIRAGDLRDADGKVVGTGTLEAIMDRPVSFDQPLPGAKPDAASTESAWPEVEALIARGDVHIESLERDDEGLRVIERRQARGESVSFERPTGRYWVDDVGTILLTAPDDASAAPSADPISGLAPRRARKPAAPAAKLLQTRIDFRKGMSGRIGMDRSGDPDGYRDATFKGDVQVLRGGVRDLDAELDQDRPPADHMYEEANNLVVESYPPAAGVGEKARVLMKADGNVLLRTATSLVRGDTTVYDSLTENVYVRGTNAPVTVRSQEAFGQQSSRTETRALRHNLRTKDTQLVEPGSMMIFEPGSGYRMGLAQAPKPKVEKPKKRPEPRLGPRSNIERSGFTGR